MKYVIYLSAVLLVLSSCKSNRFTKQRYTHYNVSHKKESNRVLTRVISENHGAPVASAKQEIVAAAPPVEATPSSAMRTEKNEMPVVSGGANPRQQNPAPSLTKQKSNSVLNLADYTPQVKNHFQQMKESSRGPISFLLRVVLSILLIIILVFLIILLIALL